MSRVTGFVLHASVCEDDELEASLNEFLKPMYEGGWSVKETASYGGGSKHPQCHVFIGGFNGFGLDDLHALTRWLNDYPWQHPLEAVAIFTYEETDLGFEDTAIIWHKQ